MTLKRSLSKKFKNTIEKTKRIVSPSSGSKGYEYDSDSQSSLSLSSFPYSHSNIDQLQPSLMAPYSINNNHNNNNNNNENEHFQGLGIFNINNVTTNTDHNQLQHTPNHSLSSIQKSVSHIISVTTKHTNNNSSNTINNSNGSNISYNNEDHDLKSSSQPVLLYTGKSKASSIRRNKSLQQLHQLDHIDTSIASSPIPINTPSASLSIYSTKESFYDVADEDDNEDGDEKNNEGDFEKDTILLLPIDPVDKSMPPFTSEQLTPIVPQNTNTERSTDRVPLLMSSNLSSTTSTTLSSSYENSTARSTLLNASSLYGSPINPSFSNTSNNKNSTHYSYPESYNLHQMIQHDVNSIFTKFNQIDHFDKDMDIRKNDRLADQMALNILQNISEENVDELSKLKEEISMKF